MKDSDMFPLISRYKIIEETIKADKFSNIVHIRRRYKIPWYRDHIMAMAEFRLYSGRKLTCDNMVIECQEFGWADYMCKSIWFDLTVIPNNGKVIYSPENKSARR